MQESYTAQPKVTERMLEITVPLLMLIKIEYSAITQNSYGLLSRHFHCSNLNSISEIYPENFSRIIVRVTKFIAFEYNKEEEQTAKA